MCGMCFRHTATLQELHDTVQLAQNKGMAHAGNVTTTDVVSFDIYHGCMPMCVMPQPHACNGSECYLTHPMYDLHESGCLNCINSLSQSLCHVCKHAQLHHCKTASCGTPDKCLVHAWLPAVVLSFAMAAFGHSIVVQLQHQYVLAAGTPSG
jgi:hypothetical protein